MSGEEPAIPVFGGEYRRSIRMIRGYECVADGCCMGVEEECLEVDVCLRERQEAV